MSSNNGKVSVEDGERAIELLRASKVRSERVRWLWKDRVPLRGVTVVAGEKGLAKSTLTNAKLAALVTRGLLPGELKGTPANVLIISAEDDWASVIKPRLTAHSADVDRVHRVSLTEDGKHAIFTLPNDVNLLAKVIQRTRKRYPVRLVVIDPIGSFVAGGIDTHRDASVRRALAPLAVLAEKHDVAIVVVAHLTKDDSTRLIHRVSGAGAFVNAARSVLVLARDPDDPDGEQGYRRVLVHVASNWGRLAKTLAFEVQSRDVELDDATSDTVGYLHRLGVSGITTEDLQRGGEDTTGPDVEEAIAAVLADGAKPSADVKATVATKLGCSKRTVMRHGVAMQSNGELDIETEGFPKTTTWSLVSTSGATPVVPTPNTRHGTTSGTTA